jgi:hypothetical protein
MLFAAARTVPLELSASWTIGDRASDCAAGRKAGLAGGMLVFSGLAAIAFEASQPLAPQASEFSPDLRSGPRSTSFHRSAARSRSARTLTRHRLSGPTVVYVVGPGPLNEPQRLTYGIDLVAAHVHGTKLASNAQFQLTDLVDNAQRLLG